MSGPYLPNAHFATVPVAKIRNYLLDAAHAGNGGKADFFGSFGFTAENWLELRSALQQHPTLHAVVKITVSAWGTKYEVRCSLPSPDDRNPCVRSFWIIDAANPNPRFLTAYPYRS
jgi:hypothetical protein